MYIPVTYEQDFDDLWMHLKSKYPEKLFNLDGVGEQLDMSKFSKKFFSSAVTSDASIDANANVDDMSVIAYEKELPKPFLKMNSYYILWKELKKLYGRPFADSVVEMQLTGDIYINDMHGIGAGKPYSYFGDTVIIAKTPNGAILYTTMEDVFNRVAHDGQLGEREDCEEYTPEKGWEILDNNGWTKLTRILKHPSHCDLVGVETKNGRTTIVTEDHPVILKGNQCLAAEDLCCGIHELAQGSLRIDQGVTTSFIDPDYAYFVGFMIGDGYIVSIPGKVTQIRSGHFEICQKNIKNHKIWSVANRLYDNVREIKQGRALACGYKADVELLGDTGRKSHKRKMPADVLFWGKDAQLSLLAGLIDAEANINPNGIVSIRVSSFALAEQIAELIRLNNLGNCRTQLIKEYAPSGFASNHPLYGVSCRFTDRDIAKYSIKIQQSYDAVYKKVNVDGRFDSNDYRVHKLLKYQHFGNAVYDVTTASGHFYSQGLLQHNCFNYSTYDILTKGLPMVKKVKCEPPKYLYSFKSQLEQFVTIASNSTLGASGTADMLIMMAYYVKNMLNTLSDAHFTFADEDAVWRYVRENLVSFVYTINQPMRGNQCVTEDTEVLTPSGWKKYDELHVGDDIYTWHDNELRIQQVQRVNVNDYDGEMHRYRGERFDMQVTPNHRVLYTSDPLAKDFDLKPSQEIIGCEDVYIPVAARKWQGTGGTWPQVRTSTLPWDERQVVCPLEFFSLYRTNLPYSISSQEAGEVVTFTNKTNLPWTIAGELQHLCVLAGLDSTAIKLDNGRYTVQVRQHMSTLDRADKKEIVHYKGKVWCPTTEDGVVVFRHNGTVFISGNSPFTNLSVYDDNFLDKLCADYIFPDGSTPDKEIVKKLQNIYLDIMNEELQRTPLTFPVTTACFSIDKDNNIQDEAFLHNIAQKNLQWGFINMYAGSSSTLSSCCFDGSQKVFYMEDPEDGAWRIESLSRLYELYHDAVLFTMGAHGEKSMCKVIRIAGQPIYKLYLEGIKEPIPTSETHLNPVVGYGLVPSYKLAPSDKLISRGEDGKGAEVAITSISIEPAPEYVYCLEMITVPQEEALFTLPNGIITHNCRLRSEQQSEYFNSFGSGSSKIGSLGVCTINFPRLAIQYPLEEDFMEKLEEMVGVCAKVNNAKRHIVQKRINNGNEPLYKYEFMELSKQYSTCGVNGFYETIKLLGYDILTEEGQALALRILDKINDTNKIYQNKYKMPHNVEQVPGENLSIKLAEKDKLMGYQNEYNLYSNQFIPLIANADLFDRIKLQGLFDSHFSGGSICHLNVETQITDVKNMEDLIRVAAKKGVVYFAINYVLSQCTNGHMSVTNGDKCLVCGEPITDKYSRVVGFLTNIKNWHKVRREEDFPNRQFYQGEEIAPPEEEIEKVDLARNTKE